MIRRRFAWEVFVGTGFTAAYFIVGKLSLKLAFVHSSATAVWPTTGLVLAAFLLLGYRIWPAILLGAFLLNMTTPGSVLTAAGIAIGNTLEGVVGCYLVTGLANGRAAFDRMQNIFKFTFATVFATAISATIGVGSLALCGYAQWSQVGAIWRTWWLGDEVGAIVATPLVLLWVLHPPVRWNQKKLAQALLLFAGLLLVSLMVFGESFHSELKNYPLEFVFIPFLIWAAFHFGHREAATAIALMSAVATWGTVHGFGPFVTHSPNASLILAQSFMGVMAITTLATAAEVAERKRAEAQVRRLAVMDPLTGLANYRRLLESMELEIRRYGRTFRPFTILLLDLDGLKKINDTYGHLAGSRALFRVANVLRLHCREIDVAARYGGDEFAVVLPETGQDEAWSVAHRISERVKQDSEEPRISVSVGVATYPDDGETVSQLFAGADRTLYEQKRGGGFGRSNPKEELLRA